MADERILLISGGEGSGKSFLTAAEIAARYGLWQLVYLVAPKYESGHKEIDYLHEMLSAFGAVVDFERPSKGKCVLRTRDGARIETVSSEDGVKAITGTGESPDILAMVEAGKQSYDIFLACRGRVARSRGLLILSGTIEESQRWYPELVKRWESANPEGGKSFIIPTWTNTALYPDGENDAEILALKATYPADRFLERFGAVPCPPSNLVFKEFGFTRHVFDWVQFDETKPVEVWVDPGYSGSNYAVEFVQFHPRAETRKVHPVLPDASLMDVWIIDELYLTHAIHEEVIAQAMLRPSWRKVNGGVGDVVMKTHPQADRAPIDVWQQKGNVFLRGQMVDIQGNIDRHRSFLRDPGSGAPRIFFNPQCKGVTGEYGRWKRKQLGENVYGDPEKINCDGLKAIGYGLIDHFGAVDAVRASSPRAPVRGVAQPYYGRKPQ